MDGKVLALSSLVAVAVGSVVLASPPVRRFLAPQGGIETQYDPSLDPAVGSVFPLPKEDAFGHLLPTARRTIVVIAGVCTSCSLHAIDPRQVVPKENESVLFAYQAPARELPPWMRRLPPNVRVLSDEDATLRKAANSVWQPRYVVLDGAGRLQDLSKDDAGVPDYVPLRRST